MPKVLINYQKCVMYKVQCKTPDTLPVYVLHTTDFKSVKCRHKRDYNSSKATQYSGMYHRIKETGGLENYDIEIIESFPCTDQIEAKARENQLYAKLNPRPQKVITQKKVPNPNSKPLSVAHLLKWNRLIGQVHDEMSQLART